MMILEQVLCFFMRKVPLIFAVSLLLSFAAAAAPAYRGTIVLEQTDGSEIRALLRGDEFCHTLTAEDGSLISRGADGFYYYSSMTGEGTILRSGYRYGNNAPEQVISSSRKIPGKVLSARHNTLQSFLGPSPMSVSGTASEMNGLVILIGFQDVGMTYQADVFNKMLNQEGYSDGGATGSARDYFMCQSGGRTDFSFDVIYAGSAPHERAYYGADDASGNDVDPAGLVADACMMADGRIDFSRYDSDGDGEVDNVYIFYAGADEAAGGGEDCIWSHSSSLKSRGISLTLDGVSINRYAMSSELHRYSDGAVGSPTIGVFCHEFSHTLGLLDMYDADYEKSGGESEGLWYYTSVMDMGCYSNDGRTPPSYNAIEMEMLGFGTGEALDSGIHTIQPICSSHKFYTVDTDVKGVRYYLECRSTESWDTYVGGNGLLVYRVDKSENMAGYSSRLGYEIKAVTRWAVNEVNCNPGFMCAKILPAGNPGPAGETIDPAQVAALFYPGAMGKYTTLSFDGSLLVISDIKRSGTDVKISVKGPVSIDNVDVFQDAAVVSWHMDTEGSPDTPTFLSWNDGKNWKSVSVMPYTGNSYSYTIEGLAAASECSFRIECMDESGNPLSLEDSFTTLTSYGNQPYIYLASADRYIPGAFRSGSKIPLRVFDGSGVVSVEWYLDGKPISVEGDGYYTVSKGGLMKAVLHFIDGSSEIIQKKIIVK